MATLHLKIKTTGTSTAQYGLNLLLDTVENLSVAFYNANVSLERTETLLTGVMGSAEGSADAMSFLVEMAERAPFAVDALTDSFTRLQIAGLDPMAGSLDSITNAVSAFGGTSEDLKLAAIAIQQMAGKGVISMEELRRQLSERVPTAIRDMAQGLGMTYAELTKKVGEGQVEALSAIEAMLGVWNEKFDGSNLRLRQTMQGTVTYMGVQWKMLLRDLGNKGAWDDLVGLVEEVGNELKGLRTDPEFQQELEEISNLISHTVQEIFDNKEGILTFFGDLTVIVGGTAKAMLWAADASAKLISAAGDATSIVQYDLDIGNRKPQDVDTMGSHDIELYEDQLKTLLKTEEAQAGKGKLYDFILGSDTSKEITDEAKATIDFIMSELDRLDARRKEVLNSNEFKQTYAADYDKLHQIAPLYTYEKSPLDTGKEYGAEPLTGTAYLTDDKDTLSESAKKYADDMLRIRNDALRELEAQLKDAEELIQLDGMGEQGFAEFKIDEKYDAAIASAIELGKSYEYINMLEEARGIEIAKNTEKYREQYKTVEDSKKTIEEMVADITDESASLKGMAKYYADIETSAKKLALSNDSAFSKKPIAEQEAELQKLQQALIDNDVATGKFKETLIQAGRESDNVWAGVTSELLSIQDSLTTTGELGASLTSDFVGGIQGSLSSALRFEFDDALGILDSTLASMEKSIADWAADQIIELGIDFFFGGSNDLSTELKSILDMDGPSGAENEPYYVVVKNMPEGGFSSGSSSGWDFDSDGSSLDGLGSIFEMGTSWDTIATNLDTNLASSLDSMDWSATGDALAGASSDIFFDTGGDSPWSASSYSDLFTQSSEVTPYTNAISDISFADMAQDSTTWDDVTSYASDALTAAAGAYAVYNGIEEGGVSGAFTATSGAYSVYGAGVDAGLYEASPYITEAGSYLGAAGGAYSMYEGIESGNWVQTGTGAIQTTSALADMFPELASSITDSVSSMFAGEVAADVATDVAVSEGATIAASEGSAVIAAEGAGTAAAGEGAAMATGATLSSTLGFLGFAASVGMMWNESNQYEKWNLSDSWDGQVESTDTVKSWGVGEDTMTKLADDVKSNYFVDQYDYASVDSETNSMLAVALDDLGAITGDLFQYNIDNNGTGVNWAMMNPDGTESTRFNGDSTEVAVAQMLEEGFKILYQIDGSGRGEYTLLEGQGDGELYYSEATARYLESLNAINGGLDVMNDGLQSVTDSSHILSDELIQTSVVTTAEGEALLNSTVNFTDALDPAVTSMKQLEEQTGHVDNSFRDFNVGLAEVTDSTMSAGDSLTAFYAYLDAMGQSAESFSNSVAISSTRFGDDSNYWQPTTMIEAGATIKYHAAGGVLGRPTVIDIAGEDGYEAVTPLHAGPDTLKKMHDDIKAGINAPINLNLVGDDTGFMKFIRVEADRLITTKAQRGVLDERVEF